MPVQQQKNMYRVSSSHQSMEDARTFYSYFVHTFEIVRSKLIELTKSQQRTRTDMDVQIGTMVDEILEYIDEEPDPLFKKSYQGLVQLLGGTLLDEYIKGSKDGAIVAAFHRQVSLIHASLSLTTGLDFYTPTELQEVFAGKRKMDVATVCVTFDQIARSVKYSSYVEQIYPFLSLDGVRQREMYSWDDVLQISLLLRAVWMHVGVYNMNMVPLSWLLQSYLYRGVVCGIPIRELLSRKIYEAPGIFELLDQYGYLMEMCDTNDEKIPTDTQDSSTSQPLADTIKRYIASPDTRIDGYSLQQKVDTLYADQPGRDVYKGWLLETLDILLHLNKGTLIEKAAFEEKSEMKVAQDEKTFLIQKFMYRDFWNELVKYFSDDTSRISLGGFLHVLRYGARYDLGDKGTVETFMAFSQLLHDKNILKSDEEIIEYHEEDEKFHWSDELFLKKRIEDEKAFLISQLA
jgi:hypothetical protein